MRHEREEDTIIACGSPSGRERFPGAGAHSGATPESCYHASMHQLPPLPRSQATELLDRPIVDLDALAANLGDLRVSDQLIGATRLIWQELQPLLAKHPPATRATLLDVATGRADGPRILASMAHRAGYSLQPYASDVLMEVLRIAQRQALIEQRPIQLIGHDTLQIPFQDCSLDFATCALALHHFAPDAAVTLLQELARVSRTAILVDLRRTRLGYLGARLMAYGPWGTMARHDGPLSVLRAYTLSEVEAMIATAGVHATVRSAGPLLMSIIVQGRTLS